jgi:hypothetical protein
MSDPVTPEPKGAARIRELEALLKLSTEERDATRLRAEQAEARADSLRAQVAPPVPVDGKHRLLVRLRLNGATYPADSVLPFDPENPPPGCTGLQEGVHYALIR